MVGAYTKQSCNENHTHIGYGFFNEEIILNLILRVVCRNRNLRMDKFKDTCQMWVSSILDRILPALGETSPPVWVLEYYYDSSSKIMRMCDYTKLLRWMNFMDVKDIVIMLLLLYIGLRRCKVGSTEVGTKNVTFKDVETSTDEDLSKRVAELRKENRRLRKQLGLLRVLQEERNEMNKLKKYVMLRGGRGDEVDGWTIKKVGNKRAKVYYCDLKGRNMKTMKDVGDRLELEPLYRTRSSK